MNGKFHKFVSFYWPYLGLFCADLLCAGAVSGIALLLPLGARYITKNVLEGDLTLAAGKILQAGLIMLLLILLQAGCAYFTDYKGHAMGAMMERDMRAELFEHCQRLSFSYYDDHSVGDLMARITGDSLSLTEFFHHCPEDIVVNLIKFVGASLILFTIHWKLTLLILAFLPVMTVYTLIFNRKMGRAMRRSRERMSDVNARTEDSLSGIRVVQSFGNEALETEKFAEENQRFCKSRKEIYRSEAVCYGGADAFANLIPVAVVVFGGLSILQGSLDLADLVVFLLYVSYFTDPIKQLIHMTQQFQEGMASFHRFLQILDTEPEIKDQPGARELGRCRGEIEFSHVDFRYQGGGTVLQDLNLRSRAGEYVALVGASGVGKTTLCSLLPRFYDVTAGEIRLDGISVKQFTLHSLRQNIGVVQQSVYLFSGTVAENIGYGRPNASREEIVEAAKRANAHDFITALPQGYDTDIGSHGVKLSGGQQQRLSIARVFLKDPPVLIFDEATSALDNESERVVQRSLEQLAENRTSLVIAHRLSTVRGAKRILVLDGTGICEEGAHEDLMAQNGIYARLYRANLAETKTE